MGVIKGASGIPQPRLLGAAKLQSAENGDLIAGNNLSPFLATVVAVASVDEA